MSGCFTVSLPTERCTGARLEGPALADGSSVALPLARTGGAVAVEAFDAARRGVFVAAALITVLVLAFAVAVERGGVLGPAGAITLGVTRSRTAAIACLLSAKTLVPVTGR